MKKSQLSNALINALATNKYQGIYPQYKDSKFLEWIQISDVQNLRIIALNGANTEITLTVMLEIVLLEI